MLKKILAIDDEPSVTRMIKLNLEETGLYEVLAVNEATSALPAARRFMPDLILLDIMMPGMDGGDVAAEAAADPVLKHVPIIYLTAAVTKEELGVEPHFSGGRRLIAKPITTKELIDCIEETLSRNGTC